MEQILAAFITGLTAGGLSCLAVQGGLLASSLAHQIERDLAQSKTPTNQSKKGQRKQRAAAQASQKPPQVARPILLFLGAKLVAYTLLGMLLGLLGQTLQLNYLTRAILQIAIGIFMIGSAMRMFNVHPIFRYFSFEPPAALRRYIRQRAKGNDGLATPLFLGVLTVLIPCGVTQAMMALAVGTGSPAEGAAILFAFTLGASPVFFLLAYFATRLGSRLEKAFVRIVAVVVLVLGLLSVETGLNLMGSPLSITHLARGLLGGHMTAEVAPSSGLPTFTGGELVNIKVTNEGYFPAYTRAQAGVPIQLQLTTEDTYSCALAFVIPSLRIEHMLPTSGVVTIDLPTQNPGTVLNYTCSMGMYTGQIAFDQ